MPSREDAYGNAFKYAPLSLWIEDFSEVSQHFNHLRKKGIKDFKAYFSANPEEVLSLARQIRIVDANEATLRMYGAKSIEDFTQGLGNIFSKESYDVFTEELAALAEGATEFSSDTINITLGGEKKQILIRLQVPPEHVEDLSRVYVAVMDISDRIEYEEELREKGEKFRRLFNMSLDAVFVVDARSGIIINANQRAGRLLGIPFDRIRGMHCAQLVPPEQAETCRVMLEGHKGPRGWKTTKDFHICRRDGASIPVSMHSYSDEIRGLRMLTLLFREEKEEKTQKKEKPNMAEAPAIHTPRRFSSREREVLRLITLGYTSKQIGEQLGISQKTVETHRHRLMGKLNIHRTADLVRYALSSDLLK